jgi:hypothetical protein
MWQFNVVDGTDKKQRGQTQLKHWYLSITLHGITPHKTMISTVTPMRASNFTVSYSFNKIPFLQTKI